MKKNQIPLVLGLLGILAAVAVYMLVFKPTKEKVDRMKAEDQQLTARIAELEALRDQRDFFIEETEKMSARIDEIFEQFPAGVMAEDAIREGIDIEDGSGVVNASIAYDTPASIYTPMGTSLDDLRASSAGEADVPSPDSGAASDDVDAAPAPAQDETIETGYNLMQQGVVYTFNGDLSQVERAAQVINNKEDRDVITLMALVYDESTGLLAGEIDLSKYYITGRDGVEHTPATFNVPTGSANLFSTRRAGDGSSGGGSSENGGSSEGNGAAAAPAE